MIPSAAELSNEDFIAIQQLVLARSGIALADSKKTMVSRRLRGRLKALGLSAFSEYRKRLDEDAAEVTACLNAISTNLTAFFRMNRHFELLQAELLPNLLRRNRDRRRLRIWSAGCSSGQEAYSIAMVVCEALERCPAWDARVLGTDLNSEAIELAREGIYREDALEGVSVERLHRFFYRGRGARKGWVRVGEALSRVTTFHVLNLMDGWPMRQRFDVIFCRNVIIYLEPDARASLIERFANVLEPEGYLILGHSESLYYNTNRFKWLGDTVFQLVAPEALS